MPARPLWIPMPPAPPATPQERVRYAVRRYGFTVLAVVTLSLIAALLFLLSDTPGMELDIHELAVFHDLEDQGPLLPTSAPPSAETVALSVSSLPTGATVLLDFDSIGVTPLHHRLGTGVYVLSVRKDRHADLDTVIFLRNNGPADFTFSLNRTAPPPPTRRRSALRPDSRAKVTPQGLHPIAPEHVARNRNERQQTAEEQLPGASISGGLRVDSEPAGASVWLDDKLIGETPLALPNLHARAYALRVQKKGYDAYRSQIRVAPGQTRTVKPRLKVRHW